MKRLDLLFSVAALFNLVALCDSIHDKRRRFLAQKKKKQEIDLDELRKVWTLANQKEGGSLPGHPYSGLINSLEMKLPWLSGVNRFGGEVGTANGRTPRIVGGVEAGKQEFPSMVLLGGCGANLVAKDVVLSAAHCVLALPWDVDDRENFTVHVGAWQRNNYTVNDAQKLAITSDLELHPLFDWLYTKYDMMLFKIQPPKEPTWIKPSRINLDPNNPSGSDMLKVIGFGTTLELGNTSKTLMKVDLPHVPYETCSSQIKGLVDNSSMLCAGALPEGGISACHGDSGGPIFDSAMTQVGVVSWGLGCARPGFPGVFARISGALDWILPTVCNLTDFKDELDFNCDEIPPFVEDACEDNPAAVSETCTGPGYTDYRGCVAETVTGFECQPWLSQNPNRHEFTPENYPNAGLVGNYCRNPDGDPGGPWCFSTSSDLFVRWEYCYIPECNNGLPSCMEQGQSCASAEKCCDTSLVCSEDLFGGSGPKCTPCAKEYWTCTKDSDCCSTKKVSMKCEKWDKGSTEGICEECVPKGESCYFDSMCCHPQAKCKAPSKPNSGAMMMKPPTRGGDRVCTK